MLQEWLQKQGLSAKDQQAVINGFKDTEDDKQLAVLSFRDFALRYQWLCKILEVRSYDVIVHASTRRERGGGEPAMPVNALQTEYQHKSPFWEGGQLSANLVAPAPSTMFS